MRLEPYGAASVFSTEWEMDEASALGVVDLRAAELARGLGRRLAGGAGLYGAVMARARAAGHERVVCEVNVEPTNEGSMRLHEGLGFRAVGDGIPAVGTRVIYLELGL